MHGMMNSGGASGAAPAEAGGGSAALAPGRSTLIETALGGVSGSSGAPLPDATRGTIEGASGADLSGVRVHTGDASATAAAQLGARAFTTGQDIHFGAGEYQPGTQGGDHLLAHEVAHTIQQGGGGGGVQTKLAVSAPGDAAETAADSFADSIVFGSTPPLLAPASAGVVHRTPAAPTFHGVTGTRDLSKIRIDAIADFVASTLTAPRAINAHLLDPSLVHLTWELYDPNDQWIDGFSTQVGGGSATTAPFQLQPRYFSGAGFTGGRYVLRCSGLNAQNEPTYFADRDFNVMAADQTTGTAAATGGGGSITFTQYDKTDGTHQNPSYHVDVQISFTPDRTADIHDAVFMQATQTLDAQGRSQHYTTSADQDARQTPQGWSIDRVAGAPGPFYIENSRIRRRHGHSVREDFDDASWGQAGAAHGANRAATPATLIDNPNWNHENFFKAESVVICRSGPHRGQIYGACTWGYTADSNGQVTLMPRTVHPLPSDEFTEAKAAWNTWRANQPAATQPRAAP